MTEKKIELTLPASLEYSSLVRQISEEVFSHVGFTKEWANRLKLVVDELFMNANRYGSSEDDGKVYISYLIADSEIHFTIEDEGRGEKKVTPDKLKELIKKNADEMNDITKTCGRGLALISDLWTDELTIDSSPHGGLRLSFKKKISAEAPPAPPIVAPVAKESAKKPEPSISPVAPQGPAETIALEGEIDQSNLEEKVKPIEEKVSAFPENGVLVLDCEKLKYFNSTFIGHLAAWHNKIQAKGGQLVLKNTSKEVQEVLELVGLSRVIYMEK